MRKIIILLPLALAIAIMATGCAHTGLVTGEKVDSPNVDRNNFTAAGSGVSGSLLDSDALVSEFKSSMTMPDGMANSIANVQSNFSSASSKADSAINSFSQNQPDTSIPDMSLPDTTDLQSQAENIVENMNDIVSEAETATLPSSNQNPATTE